MAAPTGSPSNIIDLTVEYVKQELANFDGSHDYNHIERVWKLARRLARDEGLPADRLEVVQIAALMHDIGDYKYSGKEHAGEEAARAFLTKHSYPADKIDLVCRIIHGVGFKHELSGGVEIFPELAIVQDADRLDAIGAIGIARTFSYGGLKKRPFYTAEPPKEFASKDDYVRRGGDGSTVNHFHEKLLKLKSLMKTKSGRAIAEERHAYMEAFLAQFWAEVEGNK